MAIKMQAALEVVKFEKIGMTVCKQAHPAEYVYFVKEGEFEMIKDDLSSGLDHRLFSFVESDRDR
jgi:CRP-like cAMP-binding protein